MRVRSTSGASHPQFFVGHPRMNSSVNASRWRVFMLRCRWALSTNHVKRPGPRCAQRARLQSVGSIYTSAMASGSVGYM